MFTFCIPVSMFSNAVPETYIIPCYFCQAKFFKIPLWQLPDFFSHRTKRVFIFAWKQCIIENIWLDNLNSPFFPALKLLV